MGANDRGYLFSELDLRAVIDSQGTQIAKEVEGLEANRLLNTAEEDLIAADCFASCNPRHSTSAQKVLLKKRASIVESRARLGTRLATPCLCSEKNSRAKASRLVNTQEIHEFGSTKNKGCYIHDKRKNWRIVLVGELSTPLVA